MGMGKKKGKQSTCRLILCTTSCGCGLTTAAVLTLLRCYISHFGACFKTVRNRKRRLFSAVGVPYRETVYKRYVNGIIAVLPAAPCPRY